MEPAHEQVAIWPSVDWVTGTAISQETKESLWALSRGYEAQSIVLGELRRPWGAHGYRGWTTDHFAYGERGDGAIIRLGGWKADAGWSNLVQLCDHVTRLDLACTILMPSANRSIAREAYAAVCSAPRREGRPVTARLIEGSDCSSTTYIGSRQSTHFARIYDKGVESKQRPAGWLWRYELEIKEEPARACAVALQGHGSYRRWLAGALGQWLRLRGVSTPWDESATLSPPEARELTSAQKSLSWLALAVRPLVHKLIDALGPESVHTALDLTPSGVAFVSPAA